MGVTRVGLESFAHQDTGSGGEGSDEDLDAGGRSGANYDVCFCAGLSAASGAGGDSSV